MERKRVTMDPVGPSRVKQSFRDGSDINNIMKKYLSTGVLPYLNPRTPKYGDFTSADDYFACALKVRAAEEAWLQVPSDVRNYCGNDVGNYFRLIEDESLREDAYRLGVLARPGKAPGTAPVEPGSPISGESGSGSGSGGPAPPV